LHSQTWAQIISDVIERESSPLLKARLRGVERRGSQLPVGGLPLEEGVVGPATDHRLPINDFKKEKP
jgi:hypothetical protein